MNANTSANPSMVRYERRRGQLEAYFDRTAVQAWAAITTDAPVGRIRATVRAGRDRMRETLLSYLPSDLSGQTVLDAGCGTGMLATCLARRGARVVAVDISPTLVNLGRERTAAELGRGSIEFHVGDMLDPRLGSFDWVVAQDSLIHYPPDQLEAIVTQLCARTAQGMVFTFAPRTPLLTLMHVVGKLFPRGNRSPDLRPISERALRKLLARQDGLQQFSAERSERIKSGFYTSQTMELVRR